MRNLSLAIPLLLSSIFSYAQSMRPVEDLINTKEPGWTLVQQWIASAKNKVEVLPCDTAKAKDALYKTQVTTRSPMGAIVLSTGGILIDDGWIRILGSGSPRLSRTLPEWNKGKTFMEYGQPSPFYLVADDAIGGFFAVNGGGLGKDAGKVYYLSPDNLEWEAMDQTYSDFLEFCFSGNLDRYYKGYRWKGWRKEVTAISGDQAFNFYPPLFSKEGKDLTKSSRKAVPVEEQYSYTMEMKKQLGIK
jgi:Protein of unknown function DUF2625